MKTKSLYFHYLIPVIPKTWQETWHETWQVFLEQTFIDFLLINYDSKVIDDWSRICYDGVPENCKFDA
jgi:hypothetical protein